MGCFSVRLVFTLLTVRLLWIRQITGLCIKTQKKSWQLVDVDGTLIYLIELYLQFCPKQSTAQYVTYKTTASVPHKTSDTEIRPSLSAQSLLLSTLRVRYDSIR